MTEEAEIVKAVKSDLEGRPFTPFKISSVDELKEFMMIARGHDPDSLQTINRFLDFSDEIERTNLPTMTDVVRVSFLDFLSEFFFPDFPYNPFKVAAIKQAKSLMARKGEKSKQFVEMTKQTPSLADLQTSMDELEPRGLMDRLRGRG